MSAVNIGIGGDDNFMITKFGDIESVSYCCAEGDH